MKPDQEALTHLNSGQPKALAQRGESCRLREGYSEALAYFNQAIALKPDYAWAMAHRGETYRHLGRYQEALADFNQALSQSPEYLWAKAHRGATYCQLRFFEEALADLDQSIALKPDYAWALIYRTHVLVALQRYEQALADFDRAMAINPAIMPHWQGERGLLLNYLGRYAETIAACRQVLQENPTDHVALYSLAVARVRHDGLAAGSVDISKAQAMVGLKANSEARGLVLYRLGGLAVLAGLTEQALIYLQEAIRLHPEPFELARHDPAWLDLRADSRFQQLIAQPFAA